MATDPMTILEVKGEWRGEPVQVEVDKHGDCIAYIGGQGRGMAKKEAIGLVNPFAFELLMKGLGLALGAAPEDRLLRVTDRARWTKGGVDPEALAAQEGGT